MLPLVSNSIPTESGASSLAKAEIVCSTPSSNSRKFSLLKVVTVAPNAVVTWVGTSTNEASTRTTDGDSSAGRGPGRGKIVSGPSASDGWKGNPNRHTENT